MEAKIRKIGQEQEEVREKERMMTTECEGLREKIRCREDEKVESHNREERMQRQCQQIKAQLDQCRKEQEKLLMQIKQLLTEREKFNEEQRKREESVDYEVDRAKQLEQRLS